jgi:hypothetical protein
MFFPSLPQRPQGPEGSWGDQAPRPPHVGSPRTWWRKPIDRIPGGETRYVTQDLGQGELTP